MVGSRPRRPSASPAAWWVLPVRVSGLAKRGQREEPTSPESKSKAVPGSRQADLAPDRVVVLPTSGALPVLIDDTDLLLGLEPTSVRQVPPRRHPHAGPKVLLGSGVEGPWGQGLERGAFLSAPWKCMALRPGFFCTTVPEVACQEEAKRRAGPGLQLPEGWDGCCLHLSGWAPPFGWKCVGLDLQSLVSEPWP